MDNSLCTSSGGQGVLVWGAGLLDVLGELLRKASRHQSAKEVSDHEAPDPSVRLLEGNEASEA